ncbi:MAG: Asp-tRNA(Asn)/Glu-tRNA(Gln) amidotransferase subunit GatA [Spirochaetota bacterium]
MASNELSISELTEALAAKKTSAVDAVQSVFKAIDTDDGSAKPVGAYIELYREEAIARAKECDKRIAGGEKKPLLGVPIALKDNIAFQGHALTCASKILSGYVAPYNAHIVNKLVDAGANIIGRLNMDEFAMGSSTENSAVKVTRNPHDRDRIPGGSSGGCAAAVAAHHAFGSFGSDTGGSIRQPASLCGVIGMKPTYGLVSRYGLTAFGSSLDQIGPFAKTISDTALLLSVIAGHDANDSTSVKSETVDYRAHLADSIKGKVLGLPKEYFVTGIHPDVKARVMEATKVFGSLGAKIEEISLPHTEYGVSVYYIIGTAEASSNLARFDGVRYGKRAKDAANLLSLYERSRTDGFGEEVKRRILLGTYVLSSGYYDAYYMKALKVRTLIARDFTDAFRNVDAIIAPTSPTTAFKIGEKTSNPLEMYLSDIFTITVNLAGLPALSMPCGVDGNGLPIGLQLIGKAFDERTVLTLANAYEAARGR